ncbi:MAG TPA: 3D domain-containing protein [Vicinamibacterales bacterium]|jgi:3D (Asp-Asp-Asp) domain-containing protein
MFLTRSFGRKFVATAIGLMGFFLIYEATIIDPRSLAGELAYAAPAAGSRLEFTATAYCKGRTTASGVLVQAGIAAADPALLPEGSVIRVEGVPERHHGIYTVLDTGPLIQGRRIDLYMWSCYEALDFGRRPITVTVLRLGWNPRNTAPSIK